MNNKIYNDNLLYNLDELTENSLSLRKEGMSYIVWEHFKQHDEKDISFLYLILFFTNLFINII